MKKKINMGSHPEIRIGAMREAYNSRGKSVPLRFEVAAAKALEKKKEGRKTPRVGGQNRQFKGWPVNGA